MGHPKFKLQLSNFIHMEIISSLARWMTNHSKRGVVGLTQPIFAHATVYLEKFHHVMLLTENNVSTMDLFLASTALDANALRLQLHRFNFLLQTCLYNMSTTNRSSALQCMYVLITDR